MDKEGIKKRIEIAILNMPVISTATLKIIDIANNMKSTPRDLIQVIRVDPVLTGKLLKVVNSSYMGLPQEVTELNRVLVLLGLNTIKNVCLSTAIVDATRSTKPQAAFNLDDLWMHMLSVGVTAKLLAKAAGHPKKELEEFFVAGLLHDIGDMVLMRDLPEIFQELINQAEAENRAVADISTEMLGLNGHDIGVMIAEHWQLPEQLKRVIAFKDYKGKEKAFISQVIFIADQYCRGRNLGFVVDNYDCEIHPNDMRGIGLTEEQFESALHAVDEEIKKSIIFLEN